MSTTSSAWVHVTGVRRGSLKISPGILTSVTINPQKSFLTIGQQFWVANLALGPTPEDGVIDTLVSGYTLWPCGLSWHGFLEIQADTFLILEGIGTIPILTDAIAIESRIVLTVNGSLTKYLMKINGVEP